MSFRPGRIYSTRTGAQRHREGTLSRPLLALSGRLAGRCQCPLLTLSGRSCTPMAVMATPVLVVSGAAISTPDKYAVQMPGELASVRVQGPHPVRLGNPKFGSPSQRALRPSRLDELP